MRVQAKLPLIVCVRKKVHLSCLDGYMRVPAIRPISNEMVKPPDLRVSVPMKESIVPVCLKMKSSGASNEP